MHCIPTLVGFPSLYVECHKIGILLEKHWIYLVSMNSDNNDANLIWWWRWGKFLNDTRWGRRDPVGLIWDYFAEPWFMNKSVYSQNLQTVVASVLERCFGVQCTNTPQDKMPASPFDKVCMKCVHPSPYCNCRWLARILGSQAINSSKRHEVEFGKHVLLWVAQQSRV